MRIHALTMMTIALAACAGESGPLEKCDLCYDDSTTNLRAQGELKGEMVDISEFVELSAERGYDVPALPGTMEPDFAQAKLTSVEINGKIMRDGVEYKFQLDIEGDDLSSFAVGSIEPKNGTTIQFEFENRMTRQDLGDDAMSGAVEVMKYDDEMAAPEGDKVRLGGAFGGTFDIVLMTGDSVKGAFHAPFGDPDISTP